MAYETVTVELNPPRTVKTDVTEYVFSAPNLPDIRLPFKHTRCVYVETPDGLLVTSITLPSRMAERNKLVPESAPLKETNEPDTMTRHDWFMAAAITGFCSGTTYDNINDRRTWLINLVEAARKIADKATQ